MNTTTNGDSNTKSSSFDRIADLYHEAAESWQQLYDRIREYTEPIVTDRDVMDIGNGGVFVYDTSRTRRVIALDCAREMLDRIDDPKVEKRVGDARNLSDVEDASLDVVLFIFSIHHMAGGNVEESKNILGEILSSAVRVLRPGGHLIIAEPVCSPFIFRIEAFLYPLVRRFLARSDVEPILFYSVPYLEDAIAHHFDSSTTELVSERLPLDGWTDPLGGTFPGLLKIPSWLHPLRYQLFSVKRKEPRE